ncbi:MAG TPA: hypothetical protein VK828_03360 [Terriglobales bacterium]|jgi:hypothetical protein|nr:hypothetical protein [Terriglobales bacterium]
MKSSHTTQGPAATDAASTLLRDLIDYAGLFPPASLSMSRSVANYDEYLRSGRSWILGRFILPVARLAEFEDAFARLPNPASGENGAEWRLSALLGSDGLADAARISEFNLRLAKSTTQRSAVIESVELKVTSSREIERISAFIPRALSTYCEIPTASATDCIPALARSARRAKIRTGGETADKFPAPDDVVEFIRLCAANNVPFKATAGLHHPLRSIHRLTYQPESPLGMMHGFINLFLAAAFLRAGMNSKVATQLLEEQSPQAFHFDEDGVSWHEDRLSVRAIAAARQDFAVSFGSCSFTEPIDDLRSLSLL